MEYDWLNERKNERTIQWTLDVPSSLLLSFFPSSFFVLFPFLPPAFVAPSLGKLELVSFGRWPWPQRIIVPTNLEVLPQRGLELLQRGCVCGFFPDSCTWRQIHAVSVDQKVLTSKVHYQSHFRSWSPFHSRLTQKRPTRGQKRSSKVSQPVINDEQPRELDRDLILPLERAQRECS